MGLSVFSLPISLVMVERIYTLSCYHHQIGSMDCYPLCRVRSWNNGMRCMSLYILKLVLSLTYLINTMSCFNCVRRIDIYTPIKKTVSDNDLLHVWCQTFIRTNAVLLSNRSLGKHFSENKIRKQFSYKKILIVWFTSRAHLVGFYADISLPSQIIVLYQRRRVL